MPAGQRDTRRIRRSTSSVLAQLWEAISPDPVLGRYEDDYRWLAQVYESLKPPSGNGKLLWHALGAKTIELIHEHVHVQAVRDDLETLVLDADVLEELLDDPDGPTADEVEIKIAARLRKHINDPKFVALSERLENLRARHEQGLLPRIDFLKELLDPRARRRRAEKEVPEEAEEDQARQRSRSCSRPPGTMRRRSSSSASSRTSTRSFARSGSPAGRHTDAGEREVKKALRRTLLKYKLHNDQDLFDRAYGYIVQYY